MSGICAVWRQTGRGLAEPALSAVNRGLALSGEERLNQHVDGAAGLGVASRFATQQLHANPRLMVACDADLSNQDELWEQVGGSRRDGDEAHLLAALFERWGSDFVQKLSGNFSLVLWDKRDRVLIAAVDSFGANRLFYYQNNGVLLIATRIQALLDSGDIERTVNPRAVANVLNFTCSLAPETIIRGVQRMLPGNVLVASSGNTRIEKYWDMRYTPNEGAGEAELRRDLEAVVERAVATQCKNDPPKSVGAFLSGGTDSTTVVGMMSRARREPIRTFTIGFEEESFSELKFAEIAAKKFKTDHHVYVVSAQDTFEALPRMVRHLDEPFGNSSAIATYFCARLAAQNGVRTLLAGDGGDELFGGNERYATDRVFQLYQAVPRWLRKGLIEPALVRTPIKNGLVGKARNYTRRSNIPRLERYFSYDILYTHSTSDVFEGDFRSALTDYAVLETPSRYYGEAPAQDTLDKFLYMDVKITLGDNDLPKVTYMSELAGIQARFPFLDRSVAEFSGRIPPRLKVKGFEKRYLFKRAFQELLPPEILNKKKHGFGIPVANWMKTDSQMRELTHDTLLSRRAFERGYFRRDFVENLFREHAVDETTYYGNFLWTLLVLELWNRQFLDVPAGVAP